MLLKHTREHPCCCLHSFVFKPSQQMQTHTVCTDICNICALYKHTPVSWNTPLSPTCSACYPCCRPVRPTGTSPRAGRPTPSLLNGFNWNALHSPLRLSPLVTTATQVTVSTHKTLPTDAAALVTAARRNRAVRAAATVCTLLVLCIPPAVFLMRKCGVGIDMRQWAHVSRIKSTSKNICIIQNKTKYSGIDIAKV